MRIIKFRAKAISGEWVYGNFIHSKRFHGCSNEFRIHNQETGLESDIIIDTLGEFTGLIDKKGTEIYENDIVKWDDCSNGEYWRFAVVQISPDIQFSCSLIEQVGGIKNSSKHIFRLANFAYKDTENHLEVIGNVLKNTELLS